MTNAEERAAEALADIICALLGPRTNKLDAANGATPKEGPPMTDLDAFDQRPHNGTVAPRYVDHP